DVIEDLAFQDFSDGGAGSFGVGVGVEHFGKQWALIGKVFIKTEIFLGNLHFHHGIGVGQIAKQRREGLARLEVDRTILHLQDHVLAEFAVEWSEFIVSAAKTV